MPKKTTKSPKGGARFTPTQREEVLTEVARMDRMGFHQWDIARHVGVSQPMVCQYLKKIRERHTAAQIEERELLVQEKLAQYRDIRKEAWLAWELSKEDRVTKTTVTVKSVKPAGKNGTAKGKQRSGQGPHGRERSDVERLREIVVREGRLPDCAYLRTILRCLEGECWLLALYSTEGGQLKGAGGFDWDALCGVQP